MDIDTFCASLTVMMNFGLLIQIQFVENCSMLYIGKRFDGVL